MTHSGWWIFSHHVKVSFIKLHSLTAQLQNQTCWRYCNSEALRQSVVVFLRWRCESQQELVEESRVSETRRPASARGAPSIFLPRKSWWRVLQGADSVLGVVTFSGLQLYCFPTTRSTATRGRYQVRSRRVSKALTFISLSFSRARPAHTQTGWQFRSEWCRAFIYLCLDCTFTELLLWRAIHCVSSWAQAGMEVETIEHRPPDPSAPLVFDLLS